MLTREAGASVLDERGKLLASSPMHAMDLNSRADSAQAVALIGGARSRHCGRARGRNDHRRRHRPPIAARPPTILASGEEQIESITVTGDLLDIFVRDDNRTQTADGRADVGHLVRLNPATLRVVRRTPMQLPDQQLVGVHSIAREFFAG